MGGCGWRTDGRADGRAGRTDGRAGREDAPPPATLDEQSAPHPEVRRARQEQSAADQRAAVPST